MNPNKLKSAEEWVDEHFPLIGSIGRDEYIKAYKQIQLNAYKAGMTEAAALIEPEIVETKQETISRVLSARDRKESL